jgi:hypothetical protein
MTTEATVPRLVARSRWSAAVRCPRWAALGGLGVEPAEPSDQSRRYWARGRALGRYVADSYAAHYGEDGIIREKAVAWPGGELHGDVFVISEGLPVEVKSSTSPSSILDDAFLQLAGQIVYDPDATDKGVLEIVDPSSYERQSIPFRLTAKWRDKVEQRTQEVVRALASGGSFLPSCVCSTPAECSFKFCPYTEVAWEGWEPPPREKVGEDVAGLLIDLYRTKQGRDEKKAEAQVYDAKYKELCEQLVTAGVEPGVEYEAGPLKVKRTAVAGRETFSLSTARKAGIWTPLDDERFAPVVKVGEPHDRWSIVRGDGALIDADSFGDSVPF